MKYLTNNDISFLGSSFRMHLDEVKLVMEYIDKEAASKNTKLKSGMALAAVNTCFSTGRLGMIIPSATPTGKRREIGLLKWTYVMKYMPRKKRARKS